MTISNSLVDYVSIDDELYAIIIRKDFTSEGIKFFTPNHFSQQLGYMKRDKGYIIDKHYHKKNDREVTTTQEVLLIRSGKIRVTFYNMELFKVTERIVTSGDVIMLTYGGHGFEFLEEGEIIEVKQGPYNDELDKVRF